MHTAVHARKQIAQGAYFATQNVYLQKGMDRNTKQKLRLKTTQ